jgi:hypothetical protein
MQAAPPAAPVEQAMMMEDVEDFDVDLGSEPLPAPRSSSRRGVPNGASSGDQLSPDDVRPIPFITAHPPVLPPHFRFHGAKCILLAGS